MLKENDITIAHFDKCDAHLSASAAASIEYFTPEQKIQREKLIEQSKIEYKKQKEEAKIKRDEQQTIIDQCKASSHLDKLKTKNNIK